MTNRHLLQLPRRAGPLLALAFLLTLIGGCAQITFPELPPGLRAAPQSADTDQTPADTEAGAAEDAEVAETAPPVAAEDPPEPKPGKLYEWSGDGRDVTRIVIDTNEQTASFYAGDDRLGWTTIASGVAKHPTPRGEFAIMEKVRDKRSNLYGKIVNRNGGVIRSSAHGKDRVPPGARFVGASMPHFMRLTYDGIGMHAGPIPNPGQPASHGCIRMPPKMASAVFERVAPGTPVTVIGNGPDYGNYAERIARQQAEERARRAAAAAAAEGTALDALDAEIKALDEAGVDTSTTATQDAEQKAESAGTSAPAVEEAGAEQQRKQRPEGQQKSAAGEASQPPKQEARAAADAAPRAPRQGAAPTEVRAAPGSEVDRDRGDADLRANAESTATRTSRQSPAPGGDAAPAPQAPSSETPAESPVAPGPTPHFAPPDAPTIRAAQSAATLTAFRI